MATLGALLVLFYTILVVLFLVINTMNFRVELMMASYYNFNDSENYRAGVLQNVMVNKVKMNTWERVG